jgi:hypothetical protein
LIALFLPEPLSPAARRLVEQSGRVLWLNPLQELELRNGIRQKVIREEIEEGQAARCLRILDDNVIEGKIHRRQVFWDATFGKAEEISRRFSLRQHCRAFDLHVAIAVVSDVTEFATFDQNQGRIAGLAGLTLVEWGSFAAGPAES